MAATLLDTLATQAAQEPPELPRLTVSNTFIHYARLGAALARAMEAYKKLPDAPPQGCTDDLKDLIKNCDAAIKTATRLLEANR